MTKDISHETYTEAETETRREAILKCVLATPPKPQEASKRRQQESSQSK